MKISTPKAVIFDLDGTLVEFPRSFLFEETERIIDLLAHPQVPRAVLEDSFSDFDFFKFVVEEHRTSFADNFWRHFDWGKYPRSIALGSTLAVLTELRGRGVKSAIATARVSTLVELTEDLQPLGILEFFDVLAARDTHQSDWKCKKQQISRICDSLGVSPQETWMVGDVPADIISARDAGVGFVVAVLTGGIKRAVLESHNPDAIIGDISYLLDLLSES